MRTLYILPLSFALLAAAPVAAETPQCSPATARPTSVAAIIAGEGASGDCISLTAIAWKGALYDDVAQIYAEPRPARDPQGGNRVAYVPMPRTKPGEPLTLDPDMTVGELMLSNEALGGFAARARHVAVTGTLGACRWGAVAGPVEPLPYVRDMAACQGPGGMSLRAAETSVDAARPVTRLTSGATDTPRRLVPLAAGSPWTARFATAADALLPALASRKEVRWRPLLGGQWLTKADADVAKSLLADKRGAFAPILQSDKAVDRVILGWQRGTLSPAAEADIAARPEAEAIVCWSVHPQADRLWPLAAFDADNGAGRPYACARITYSIRGDAPTWRAFVEQGAGGLAEPAG